MQSRRIHTLFLAALLAVAVFIAWSSVPPPQGATAQDWYGPQVTSDLKRFNVDCTTLGNNTVIAAKAGTKFRIISIEVTSCSTTSDSFYLANGDNPLWFTSTIKRTLDGDAIDGPVGISRSPLTGGSFETDTVNEALVLVLTAGEDFNCNGTYVECF
jgi:hypothetical protein